MTWVGFDPQTSRLVAYVLYPVTPPRLLAWWV